LDSRASTLAETAVDLSKFVGAIRMLIQQRSSWPTQVGSGNATWLIGGGFSKSIQPIETGTTTEYSQ
jgi:hypothetical protein